MNIEQEREKLILFTKIGAIVLTSFALLATSFFVYPENRAVFNESLLHEKELPIYCVEKEKPQISISFDAAWGNDDTASLLATLKKHKVKATFFMTGGWIEKYPDDVKAIAAGGHDLGNHSENHKQMSQLSAAQCKEEIMKPHEKVKKLTGKDMILFRPPYGTITTLLSVCAGKINIIRFSGMWIPSTGKITMPPPSYAASQSTNILATVRLFSATMAENTPPKRWMNF